MQNSKNQMVDLLISHHQILVRSRAYSEKLSQWGKENIEQGAVIHEDYVIFDPLPEETFGANVFLKLTNNFVMDEWLWVVRLFNMMERRLICTICSKLKMGQLQK